MVRIVRREKRRRGILGWLFLLVFWAFNAFMALWFVSVIAIWGHQSAPAGSAESAGRAIGIGIGFWFLVSVWASGDVVLGLFVFLTRGSKVIIEETRDEPAYQQLPKVIQARARSKTIPGTAKSPRALPLPSPINRPERLVEDYGWHVEIVGESHYQRAIEDALADAREHGPTKVVIVTLDPEDENEHDPKAVRASHRGATLGYLPRAAAREYRAALGTISSRCTAAIHGGDRDDAEGSSMYGVWLGAAWPPALRE